MHEIALYNTVGLRSAKHCLVIYIGAFTDWGARQKERNGNTHMPLAKAWHTPECDKWRESMRLAASLQYNGKSPADAVGMAEDLEGLGFDAKVIARFLKAAKPYWPV